MLNASWPVLLQKAQPVADPNLPFGRPGSTLAYGFSFYSFGLK